MYSIAWASNDKKAEYTPILAKLYPNTYNYFSWDDTLRFWGEKFDISKISDSGKKVYLYLERNEDNLYIKTIDKLLVENDGDDFYAVEKELIYLNPGTFEVIYEIKFRKQI